MNAIKTTFQLLVALCVLMVATFCLNADAANLRFSDAPIPIKSSDSYEVRDLLKDLLSREGMVAVISDNVKGKFTQSGRFKPKDLF